MEEELGTSVDWSKQNFQFKGTIYNNSDEVGRVHLGLLYVVKINSEDLLEEGELDIVTDRQFLTSEELISKVGLEAWSQFIVEKLEEII
jgi:predicted NUDIX family phosphoesterase